MILSTLAAALIATSLAGDPIPADGTFTMTDFRAGHLAFERAHGVEIFRKRKREPAAWDDDALAYLDLFMKRRTKVADRPPLDDIKFGADELIESGCDDPLVHFGGGWARAVSNNLKSAETALRYAVTNFEEYGYAPHWRARAAVRLARYLRGWKRPDEVGAQEDIAIESWLAAIRSGMFDKHSRLLLIDLGSAVKEDRGLTGAGALRLCEQVAAIDGIDPWLVEMTWARYEVRAAWDSRGGGVASTVTDDGWRGFGGHLQKAAAHLEKAWKLEPNRPEAPTHMITVVKGGVGEPDSERVWFDRAVAAQFDWDDAYWLYIDSIKPKWGGSAEALYDFGLECKKTGRYDTNVPGYLIEAMLGAGEIVGEEGFAFLAEPGVYEEIVDVADRILSMPEHQQVHRYYGSIAAGIAGLLDRRSEVDRLMKRLDDRLDAEALEKVFVFPRDLKDQVTILRAGLWDRVDEAQTPLTDGTFDLAKVIGSYEAIMKDVVDDPATTLVLRDQLVVMSTMRDYIDGDWVEFRFEKGFPGWRREGGSFGVDSKNTLRGGPRRGGFQLRSLAPFGTRFELRCRFDMRNFRNNSSANMGVSFHRYPWEPYLDWQSFLIYKQSNEVRISSRYRTSGSIARTFTKREGDLEFIYDVHLKVWDGQLVAYVNDELVYAGDLPHDETQGAGPFIAFGGKARNSRGYGRVEHAAIRRLQEPPDELQAQ